MVRLKTNSVLVTSAFLVSVIIHSNYVSASDSKFLADLTETLEEHLVNFDDTGEDEVKARIKRLVPTLGYSPVSRTLRRVQRSPLEEGEDLAKGAVVEEEAGGAEESSSKKRKGRKKKKKKKKRKDKKTSSVEEPSDGTSGESDLIKGKTDSKVEPPPPSSADPAPPPAPSPLDISLSFGNNGNSRSTYSSDDTNAASTSNSGDTGSEKTGGGGEKSQGGDDGSEQRQSKSYKIGSVKVRQDSGQKSKQETINSDTKELIPIHKDLPPMQRQSQKQIHRQESSQFNRQDTSLPADSVNFDRNAFKIPQMTQMAPLPPLPNFYSPMGGSKTGFVFPNSNFPAGQQQAAPTNENPTYTGNLGYPPYSPSSGNPVNPSYSPSSGSQVNSAYSSNSGSHVNPLLNSGSNPMHQMATGNIANYGNVPGANSFILAVTNRAFGNPDGQSGGSSNPAANFFAMNGGFLNQAQSSFNSQSNSAQFHDPSFP